jgi:Ca2+-binding RTX toxin-like protein
VQVGGVYAQRYDANGNPTNSLLTNTAGNDILAGSISDDNTVTYADSTAPIKVSLNISSQQNTIGAGLDTLTGIENLIGSNYSDILTGNGKDNALLGEAGNDTLSGFSGADTMIGGLGNDNYFVENAGDVIIENFNEGIDSVNSKITYLLLDNIENITLTGVSAINGAGNNQSNIIIGNVAANQLDGRSGNDKLMGGAGNDTLNGDNNNDTLLGEIGDDTLKGGAGIDKLDGGAGNNVLTGGVG